MNKNITLGVSVVLIITAIIILGRYRSAVPETTSSEAVSLAANQDAPAEGTSNNPDLVKTEADINQVKPTTVETLTAKQKLAKYETGKELAGIAGYINTPDGLTLQSLVGKKVIIVDFWTYSCINCQRTLPYMNDWYAKYKDQGLEIIGVHTPEFAFEKVLANVQTAVANYNIKYPVVLDNDYGTWKAYQNRYWPRKYIIDIDGYVVYDHIGEGGYAETEKKIQELLAERAKKLGVTANAYQELSFPVVDAPVGGAVSPEVYFGSSRNSYLGNGSSGQSGVQTFSEPSGFKTHVLYLSGAWNITSEYATSQANAKIIYRYIAKNVFFVASSGEQEGVGKEPIVVEVLRDGKPLTADSAGEDVVIGSDGKSTVTISTAKLYKLIKQAGREEHTLELIPQVEGLEAFTFTFG